MIEILITIWCILGLIGWFFTYHTLRKSWYCQIGSNMWKSKYGKMILIILCICFPFWIIGGLWSILYWTLCYDKKYWSLYFKIKNKKE